MFKYVRSVRMVSLALVTTAVLAGMSAFAPSSAQAGFGNGNPGPFPPNVPHGPRFPRFPRGGFGGGFVFRPGFGFVRPGFGFVQPGFGFGGRWVWTPFGWVFRRF